MHEYHEDHHLGHCQLPPILLAAVLGHDPVVVPVEDLLSAVQEDGLDEAEVFLVMKEILEHWKQRLIP